jgi:hypothetical protein
MQIPVIRGLIDRRILVNFRVDPDVLTRLLPIPFRPKLVNGCMAGYFSQLDRDLRLPPGSAKKYLARAVARYDYRPIHVGEETAQFQQAR